MVPFHQHPGQGCRRRSRMSRHKGAHRRLVCAQRAPCIEPEPAKPQESSPQERQWEVVRSHVIRPVAVARAEHHGAD